MLAGTSPSVRLSSLEKIPNRNIFLEFCLMVISASVPPLMTGLTSKLALGPLTTHRGEVPAQVHLLKRLRELVSILTCVLHLGDKFLPNGRVKVSLVFLNNLIVNGIDQTGVDVITDSLVQSVFVDEETTYGGSFIGSSYFRPL